MLDFICPNCHSSHVTSDKCLDCDWQKQIVDGIPVFLNEIDARSAIFNSYKENYETISQDDLKQSIQNPTYLSLQAKKLHSYIPKEFITGKNVLEVGVGQGILLKEVLSNHPESYTAIDISTSYLKKIEKHPSLSTMIANAENIPFKDKFHLFIATDILEHVLNVGDFLISMNRAVKLGGISVMRVPFEEDLLHYAKQRKCPYEYVHLRTFNKPLIELTMKQAGFKPLNFYFDGFTRGRIRKFPMFNDYLQEKISDYLLEKFPSDAHINTMRNLTSNFLMIPSEIVVLAKKIEEKY